MSTASRYILRQILAPFFGVLAVALMALLLGRLLRLVELLADASVPFSSILGLLVMYAPQYLGIALPAALFISVLVAFARLSRNGELDAFGAAGIGVHRLLAPVVALSVLLTALAGAILGYVQPHSRYGYRALVHEVARTRLSLAFREGALVRLGATTFTADRVARDDGRRLLRVFVHEDEERPGRDVVTTARSGTLRLRGDGTLVLRLRDGIRVRSDDPGDPTTEVLSFEGARWPLGEVMAAADDGPFRPRGKDERELTLGELWAARDGPPPPGATREEVAAEFHARLVRAASTLVIPFLAVPLGLPRKRAVRSYGAALGVLVLTAYYYAVELGEAVAALGRLPAWLALWGPFAALAALAGRLAFTASFRAAGEEPLAALAGVPEEAVRRGHRALANLVGRRQQRHRCRSSTVT